MVSKKNFGESLFAFLLQLVKMAGNFGAKKLGGKKVTFCVLMTRDLIFCLGAAEGMTRHSHTEKMMPRAMVAAVSHLGTPTFRWAQANQSFRGLKQKNI